MLRFVTLIPLMFCTPKVERGHYGTCVVHIKGSRHKDMQDAGSEQLKAKIVSATDTFLAPAQHPKYACERDSKLE
jgi:hypothetical protein